MFEPWPRYEELARLVVPILVATAMVAAAGCTPSQPGCTRENCEAAVQGCRIELGGGPSTLAVVTCTSYDKSNVPVDWAKYCVDSCLSHQGNGSVIACIASKADSCRDGGFAAINKAIDACIDKTARAPERTCEDGCEAVRRECDRTCGIDRACDQCLRAGGQCQSICPDAGIKCLDCSAECGRAYTLCSDSCARDQ